MSLTSSKAGITLVVGPAWSGKTSWVTSQFLPLQEVTWLGTAFTQDPNLEALVSEIKSRRAKAWKTIDAPFDLIQKLAGLKHGLDPVVVDSLNLWMGNHIADLANRYSTTQIREILAETRQEIFEVILEIAKQRPLILISAELGASVAPTDPHSYELRRSMGILNQSLAGVSSNVVHLNCGIAVFIKSAN